MTSQAMPSPRIYLGTGGYSDTDLLGTLYPQGTKKTDFLREYAKQYGAVEINSTFYAPAVQSYRPLAVCASRYDETQPPKDSL